MDGYENPDLRFSVVIPTRERAETLKYTLRTCLAQDFENYEIIVCDNCGSTETKCVVDSFKSEKIKYIRSDRPLAMTDNWELALSHAVGEYIIFLGDDDGLLFHSLQEIDRLLKELNVKAMRWNPIGYGWPDTQPKGIKCSYMKIPLGQKIRILQGQEIISRVANDPTQFGLLPEVIHSAIHKDLIDLLRKKTGRVFKAMAPDIYSGFAIAYLMQVYAFVEYPLSIGGMSKKSTGATLSKNVDSEVIAKEFYALNNEAGFGFHPQVPNCNVLPAVVADSFQRAKDALFPNDPHFYILPKRLIINCVDFLRPNNKEELIGNLRNIRESLLYDVDLQTWFDSKFLNNSRFLESKVKPFKQRDSNLQNNVKVKPFKLFIFEFLTFLYRVSNGYYNLEVTKFGVSDVFGAAELYEKTIYTKTNGFERFKRRLLYAGLKFLNIMSSPARILFRKKIENLSRMRLDTIA